MARAAAHELVFAQSRAVRARIERATWVPVLLCAALLCGVAGVNSIMLFAFGLGVGGGLANELESRVLGEVTDFVRPGLLEDSIFAPADLAMYAATALMLVGSPSGWRASSPTLDRPDWGIPRCQGTS